METVNDLKEFFESDLRADLEQQERLRVQKLRNVVAMGVVAVVAFYLAVKFTNQILIPLAAISFLMVKYVKTDYAPDFKTKIIKRLVDFINPELKYMPHGMMPPTEFSRSQLFKATFNEYAGDDLVSGVIGKTKIDFSEVHAHYQTKRESNEKTKSYTVFKGLFFKADFNKDFRGTTFVLPDEEERIWGRLAVLTQKLDWSRPPLVKLEDRDFEHLYVVYSTDETEARYILSPALMKRLTDFRSKAKEPIFISFVGSHIYVAIGRTKDVFEASLFHSLLDFSIIKKYFEDLQLLIGIVDDLNLNSRIWTKE